MVLARTNACVSTLRCDAEAILLERTWDHLMCEHVLERAIILMRDFARMRISIGCVCWLSFEGFGLELTVEAVG